jgi:hypothetical protein
MSQKPVSLAVYHSVIKKGPPPSVLEPAAAQPAEEREKPQTWKEVSKPVLAKLQKITSASIKEVAALRNPPRGCQASVEAALIMLGEKIPKSGSDKSWLSCKKVLGSNHKVFIKRFQDFSPGSATPKTLQRLRTQYTSDPEFTVENVARVTALGAKLAEWVLLVIKFRELEAQNSKIAGVNASQEVDCDTQEVNEASSKASSTDSAQQKVETLARVPAVGAPKEKENSRARAQAAVCIQSAGRKKQAAGAVAKKTELKAQQGKAHGDKRPPMLQKGASSSRGFSSTASGSKRNLTIGVSGDTAGSAAAVSLGSPATQTAKQREEEVGRMEEVLGLTVKDGAVVHLQSELAPEDGLYDIDHSDDDDGKKEQASTKVTKQKAQGAKQKASLVRTADGTLKLPVDLPFSVIKAAITFQAKWRAAIARRAIVQQMQQKRGVLLAMPGTIQGRSGWYELFAHSQHLAIKYDVDENKVWTVAHKPVLVETYKTVIVKTEAKEKEARKAEEKAAKEQSLAEVEQAINMNSLIKMQGMVRRLRKRREHAIYVQLERRTLLACPGTVQGSSGWYERYNNVKQRTKTQIDAATAGVGRTAVQYRVDATGWHLVHPPISWEEFARQAKQGRRDSL